jgi:hypothetical protein
MFDTRSKSWRSKCKSMIELLNNAQKDFEKTFNKPFPDENEFWQHDYGDYQIKLVVGTRYENLFEQGFINRIGTFIDNLGCYDTDWNDSYGFVGDFCIIESDQYENTEDDIL